MLCRGALRVLPVSLLLLSRLCVTSATDLRFSGQGSFKVLQLTDLHYSADLEDDNLSDAVQSKLLAIEKPDLVVFSGDMVSGYLWNDSGAGWFKQR